MKRYLHYILMFLLLSSTSYAADSKLSAIGAGNEMTDIQGADILYIVDAPGGTPNSEYITATNLFDVIDTEAELETISGITNILRETEIDGSAEMIAIMDDETGTGAMCFATSPTLVTPALGTIASGVGTALTALNGENIQDDTIDDDSIDFTVGVGLSCVDITTTDCGIVTSSGVVTGTGFTIGSAAIIEAELETLDGITAGTAAASKCVVLDASKDVGTLGDVTATTFIGALTGNSSTTTTASAGDAAVDFFGAGVDAVTDTTTCTNIEGTGLSITTGTLNWAAASTDLSDTADIIYEAELNTFAELQTQIADETVLKAGTLTDTKYCIYDSASTDIICNSEGGGGGDNVEVDSAAVVDPDFQSGGDIDFVNSSNDITANINTGVILETDLSADVTAVDGDYLQYDSVGTNFTWRDAAQVLSDLASSANDWDASGDVTDISCTDCINATEIEDIYLLDGSSDVMTGTLTADGLTLGANENITLGAQTLDHDGTDFAFNDSIVSTGKITSGGAVSGVVLGGETSDPCGTLGEGAIFYNTTSNYMCYCDGTNDLKMNDNSTACF